MTTSTATTRTGPRLFSRPTGRATVAGRACRLVVCLLAVSAAQLVAGRLPAASAHTQLATTSPPANTRLAAAPDRISLIFTDPLVPQFNLASLSVDNGPARALASRIEATSLIVEIPTPRPSSGEWKLSYRVVAEDGHPITGDLAFSVDSDPSAGPTPTASPAATASVPSVPDSPPSASPSPTRSAGSPNPQISRIILLIGLLSLVALPAAVAAWAGRLTRPETARPDPDRPDPDRPDPDRPDPDPARTDSDDPGGGG